MTANDSIKRRGGALRLTGLAIVLATAITRMAVGFEPFPSWDTDPFVLATPSTAVGPAASILLDLISLAGAALAMLGAARGGVRACTPLWFVVGVGVLVVAWHARLGGEIFIDHLRIGSHWIAAVVGAAAAFEVCREERLRRIAVCTLVASVAVLACKGALQLLVEHPQTVAMFKHNRGSFFASQGWAADSAAARAFERRLLQPEASGWFGMSNVFASWSAFGAVACVGMMLPLAARRSSVQKMQRWVFGTLLLGALTGLAGVAMADSKGGWATLAIGLGLITCAAIAARRARDGAGPGPLLRLLPLVPVACVAATILAVIVRGVVGERVGEVSILFRWFYMIGAARAFAAHPIAGVGPDGFKDAYMLLKPPQSPEEVTSPHGLLLDFAATLGVAGALWAGAWIMGVWRSGRWLMPDDHTRVPDARSWTLRHDARLLFILLSVPAVVGALYELAAGTPEGTLTRLLGLGASTAVAVGVAAALRTSPGAMGAIACAAAAFAAHAQIELTAVWPGSAPAFFLVFGVLAAPEARVPRHVEPHTTARSSLAVACILMIAVGAVASMGWRPVHRWERLLDSALAAAWPAVEARAMIQQLETSLPSERAALTGALSDHLSRTLNRPIGDTESALRRGLDDTFLRCGEAAFSHLTHAASHVTHPGTLRSRSRLALQLFAVLHERGDAVNAGLMAERAIDAARLASDIPVQRASSLGWLGTVRMTVAGTTGDRGDRELAVSAWEAAAALDPYGLTWPPKLARTLAELGRTEEAADWSRKALENDDRARLDPLRALSAAERVEMSRLAAGS